MMFVSAVLCYLPLLVYLDLLFFGQDVCKSHTHANHQVLYEREMKPSCLDPVALATCASFARLGSILVNEIDSVLLSLTCLVKHDYLRIGL